MKGTGTVHRGDAAWGGRETTHRGDGIVPNSRDGGLRGNAVPPATEMVDVPAEAAPLCWLVRHPRPEAPAGLCYGRTDLAAQPADTARAAQALAARLPAGIVLRSSPLQRCQTLLQALHVLRPDVQLRPPEDWLAEMDFGAWEGRLWADLPAAELQAWTDDFGHYRAGGHGESVAQFLMRLHEGLQAARAAWETPSLRDRHGWAHAEAWITHAGVIRGLCWLAGQGRGDGASCGTGLSGVSGECPSAMPERQAGAPPFSPTDEPSAYSPADHEHCFSGAFGPAGKLPFSLPTASAWPSFHIGFGEAVAGDFLPMAAVSATTG